jgi:hypothetical protein
LAEPCACLKQLETWLTTEREIALDGSGTWEVERRVERRMGETLDELRRIAEAGCECQKLVESTVTAVTGIESRLEQDGRREDDGDQLNLQNRVAELEAAARLALEEQRHLGWEAAAALRKAVGEE